MIKFLDLSHWNGDIDFGILKNNGYFAAYVKATEGNTYTDTKFAIFWERMQAQNFLKGAYHYYRGSVDPLSQASYFYSVAKETQLPPAIDVEYTNNYPAIPAKFAANLRICVEEVERLFKKTPVIYTGYYSWKDLTGNPDWAGRYGLWLADYTPETLKIPESWDRVLFVQFTNKEPVSIYRLDCNFFYGTEQEFYALASAEAPLSLEERVATLEFKVSQLEQN